MIMQELKNPKPIIRKVYDEKTLSINIPKEITRLINIKGNDHIAIYCDFTNNSVILRKVPDLKEL
jgi:bifunctional DNA-binding transcriptional regulator/antitoxin component of YhaV-PrlF toxin-antitoxin module